MPEARVTSIEYYLDMTPVELAAELGVPAPTLRGWLRRNAPRSSADHGARWEIDAPLAHAARAHFRTSIGVEPARPSGLEARRSRADSDEAYVVDLCDQALAEVGIRQHRFPWLEGDLGRNGRRVRLPVDAWYPNANVIVEYRERQHDEPVAVMDNRPTVSGVNRGEQRRRYDEVRERAIPAHGIRLVVIRPSDLDADRRGRLRRVALTSDLDAIAELIGGGKGAP